MKQGTNWTRRVVVALVVATAAITLVAAQSADGAPARRGDPGTGNKYCYVITHCEGNHCNTIVTDDRSLLRGHQNHGDYWYAIGYCNN